jgi:catechol 2,3-dioxygenase-like lactoylglutathione lyase family enzyme
MSDATEELPMKLEVLVIPVSDVDRSLGFYQGLGWRLDADYEAGPEFRIVQLTPPGSPCSIHFGRGITPSAPGSAQGNYLVVSDIDRARADLTSKGVEVTEAFRNVYDTGTQERLWPCRRPQQLRDIRRVQRPGRQRLGPAGVTERQPGR